MWSRGLWFALGAPRAPLLCTHHSLCLSPFASKALSSEPPALYLWFCPSLPFWAKYMINLALNLFRFSSLIYFSCLSIDDSYLRIPSIIGPFCQLHFHRRRLIHFISSQYRWLSKKYYILSNTKTKKTKQKRNLKHFRLTHLLPNHVIFHY